MGKAQTKSSRKRRSVRTKSKGIGTSGYSNANDSNHYYESFPIIASEEHQAETQKNEAKIGSIKTFEDPGNPLGNAVDFCVDNITALHAKTMELACASSVDMGQEKSLDQLLGGLFLSETRDENEGGVVSTDYRDVENPNSKRSKIGWKKTKNIFKRKIFSLPDNSIEDSDNDDLWEGIADDIDPEVDDIITISIGSEQDTLFGNLGNTDTWTTIGDPLPKPYEESLTNDTKVVSDEKKFGDEGVGTERGVETSDKRCEMFFSASTLLALPSCLRERNSDTDATLEKGDMVIPRDFKKEPSILTLQEDSSPSRKSVRKREISDDIEDEEPKIEFEMILDDSHFGKRTWGKVTPWKKLESLFANSNNSRSSGGKRRRRNSRSRSTRSLSSARSANSVTTTNNEKSESTETEVVLNDKIRRKRSFQSKLLGLSSRTRSMPMPRTRIPSWKKRILSGSPEDKNSSNMEDFLSTTNAEDISTKDEAKSVESTLAGTEGDSLPCSPSDEESTGEMSTHVDTETTEIKDLSSTAVMGLQEWSWGVFNMDQKEEVDHNVVDDMSQDAGDEHDSATDYTPQDGDTYSSGNDSNHDGWIMNEDQLMTFSEEDHSSAYTSTHSSVASIDEGDDAILEATIERPHNSKKSGKPKFRAFPKAIRRTFAPKKKKRSLDGFTKDVRVNAESNDVKATDSDSDSAAIEAVLQKKETRGSFFSSLASSKKAAPPLEDRDDDYTAGSIQENNDARLATSGGAFFKAKKFLRQQSNRKRSNTISSSSTVDSSRSNMALMGSTSVNTVTNPVSASKDIITVVTTSKNENVDAATIDAAPTSVIKSPSSRSPRSHQHEYVPTPLLDPNPVDDDDHDDRDSAFDESDSAYDESSVSSSSASTNSHSWARDDEEFQSESILYAGFDFFMSPEVIRE